MTKILSNFLLLRCLKSIIYNGFAELRMNRNTEEQSSDFSITTLEFEITIMQTKKVEVLC